jgi:hypothetical protein
VAVALFCKRSRAFFVRSDSKFIDKRQSCVFRSNLQLEVYFCHLTCGRTSDDKWISSQGSKRLHALGDVLKVPTVNLVTPTLPRDRFERAIIRKGI